MFINMWKYCTSWVGRRIAVISQIVINKLLSITMLLFSAIALYCFIYYIPWDSIAMYDGYPLLLREYGKQLCVLWQNLLDIYKKYTLLFCTVVMSTVGYCIYALRRLYAEEKESEQTEIARLQDKVVDYVLQELQNTNYLFVTQDDVDFMYELMTNDGLIKKHFISALRVFRQAENRSFCELIIHNTDAQKLCNAIISALRDD
ncbi:uncharacterized protein LOC119684957 [Teleopsis dalmanni]|uniref:uncharacterized protein LOC119684957 n=1 Tax=Teleopsis dalmanni TaxID=139649 RepID=UPI0018CF1F38|nr:uncharacterized protein LOC119684957 [Teleopsis dalmanni]